MASSSGTGTFASTSGGAAVTSVTISGSSSFTTFYYGDTTAGEPGDCDLVKRLGQLVSEGDGHLMAKIRQDVAQDEEGAVLILALIFLVAVSLIVVALLSWVGTSLTATSTFASERSVESATTSTMNLAIQNTRYTFATQLLNASPPQACWYGTGGTPQQPPPLNGQQIDVWCSMVWQPFTADTRTITYSACPSTETSTQCAATPTLQAVVTFDDYAPGIGVPTANPVQCSLTGFCGQSLTQNSWQWNPVVPSVSLISPTTATVNGTNASTQQPQTVTITGSGFVQGASNVNFVQETGASGSPANTPSTANGPAG